MSNSTTCYEIVAVAYKSTSPSFIMKIDPYNHEERYKEWKAQVLIEGISDISKENSDLILIYLHDMEHGLNISSTNKKGCRSYIRLNTLREKMVFFSKKFKELYDLEDIAKIGEEQLMLFVDLKHKCLYLKHNFLIHE